MRFTLATSDVNALVRQRRVRMKRRTRDHSPRFMHAFSKGALKRLLRCLLCLHLEVLTSDKTHNTLQGNAIY